MFSEVSDCLLHNWVLSVMWECSDSNVAGEDQPSWLTLVTTEESILSPQWYCPLHTESHSSLERSERDWCDSVWCHSSESHSVSHSTVVTAEVTLISQYTVTHRAWSVEAAVTAGVSCDHPRLLSPAVIQQPPQTGGKSSFNYVDMKFWTKLSFSHWWEVLMEWHSFIELCRHQPW